MACPPRIPLAFLFCLLGSAAFGGEANDLSAQPRAAYPAQREVYRIPDLKKLVNRPLKKAFLYGDFMVRERSNGAVVLQPYSAIGLLGNVTDPQVVRRLANEGNLLLGASRVLVDEASSPIPLEAGYPIHIAIEAPLELLSVSVSQTGSPVARARFWNGAPAAPAPATPSPAAPAPRETSAPATPAASADKFAVADKRTGARVWRPYQGRIEWTGSVDGAGFASGPGTLRVYDRTGKVAAVLQGDMEGGRLAGTVRADYPRSPDRASYRGEFSNWSENGRGVMTFRNGEVVEGLWRDGELVQRIAANAPAETAAAPRNGNPGMSGALEAIPKSGWASDAVLQDLSALSAAAGDDLNATYKALRDRLPEKARPPLVAAQRAWIAFQDAALKLAPQGWGNGPEAKMRTAQLDYALTLQRTRELKILQATLEGGRIVQPSPEEERRVSQRLMQGIQNLLSDGARDRSGVQQMIEKWSQADASRTIAQACGLAPDRVDVVAAAGAVIASRHQIDLLEFWQSGAQTAEPREMASAGAEKAVSELEKTLSAEIAGKWAAADAIPEALPAETSQRLERYLALTSNRAPAGGTSQPSSSAETRALMELASSLNAALKAAPPRLGAAADVMHSARLSDSQLQAAPWAARIRQTLTSRRAKALELQAQAIELHRKGDDDAARARIEQAAKEFPSAALAAYARALDVYYALARDKSLRAADGDWQTLSLPDKASLELAAERLKELPEEAGPEIRPELSEYALGLQAAALLQKFRGDYEPAGGNDRPHPIRALQALRNTERYREMQGQSSEFAKPFLARIRALEELIEPKLKDFEKLLEEGRRQEASGKYLKAAAAYRQALALDPARALQERIYQCESKTSGL